MALHLLDGLRQLSPHLPHFLRLLLSEPVPGGVRGVQLLPAGWAGPEARRGRAGGAQQVELAAPEDRGLSLGEADQRQAS